MPKMDHLNQEFFPVVNAHLQGKDLEYCHNKGLPPALSYDNDFICKRLAPDFPEKDGKQTPFREHRIFLKRMVSKRRFEGTLYLLHNPQRLVIVVAVWNNGIDEQTYILNLLKCWLHKELHQLKINHPVQ